MSFPWFLCFTPRFAPETDASSGGEGGGGGEPAGDDAGGGAGDGDGSSKEPTLNDVLEELRATRKDFDRYKHRTNKEIERVRRGRGEKPEANDKGEGEGKKQGEHVTRDELRAERRYNRALGRLEALGLDADALEEIEDECEDMSASERARYVEAFARGLERGGKGGKPDSDETQARDRDGRRRRTPKGKGGEPPPSPRGSDVPETLAEYKALKKKDPERARKLVQEGEVDLVALARGTPTA